MWGVMPSALIPAISYFTVSPPIIAVNPPKNDKAG